MAALFVLALLPFLASSSLNGKELQNKEDQQKLTQSKPEIDDLLFSEERRTPIHKLADLPEVFQDKVIASSCPMDQSYSSVGQLIVSGGRDTGKRRRVLALLNCWGSSSPRYSLFLYNNTSNKVQIVHLPVINSLGGLEATSFLGRIEWDADNEIVSVTRGTDMIPSYLFVHYYKFTKKNSNDLFLFRIDRRMRGVHHESGQERLWEAPQWGTPDELLKVQ